MRAIDFILSQRDKQQEIMLILHEFLLEHEQFTAKISYGIPFYYRKRWVCYLNPTKDQGVELAFTRANELSDEGGLLDFRGRKQVAGLVLYESDEIPLTAIQSLLEEAIELDKQG